LYRFSIDLDLDAPKVRLLADTRLTNGLNTELILDLGHFTLHTGNVCWFDVMVGLTSSFQDTESE
jgi:arginase family enzyme